jgi:peroxiredoxin
MNVLKFLLMLLIPVSHLNAQQVPVFDEPGGPHGLLNKSAPNFEAMTLSNGPFELLDFRGKTVVLHFWSLRCAACYTELIDLNEIAKRYTDKKVVVISVLDDDKDKLLRVIEVQAPCTYKLKDMAYSANVIHFQIVPDGNSMIFTSYTNEKRVSQTFFIDKTGIVRDYSDGFSAPHDGNAAMKNIDHLSGKIDRILSDNNEN